MESSANLVSPQVGALDQLTQLQAYLALSTVHLFQAAFIPGPGTVIGDLTAIEATYTGYAAKVITAFSAPGLDAEGVATMLGLPATFAPTGTAITNVIHGGWIQSAGGILEFAFVLPTAKGMASAVDFLNLVVGVQQPGPGFVSITD